MCGLGFQEYQSYHTSTSQIFWYCSVHQLWTEFSKLFIIATDSLKKALNNKKNPCFLYDSIDFEIISYKAYIEKL